MNKILIVDSCEFSSDMLKISFETNGYEVDTAVDGEQALIKAANGTPSLLVVDLENPEIDGMKLTRVFKSMQSYSKIPIILLCPSDDLDFKLDAFQAGANDVLTKPFNFHELLARTSAHIRRNTEDPGEFEDEQAASLIGFHSLRGGVGCSSVAVNTAMVLQQLWNCNTLLVDAVPWAGQTASLLNSELRNSWETLRDVDDVGLDSIVASKVVTKHESGLDQIIAPFSSTHDVAQFLPRLKQCISRLESSYDYIILDLEKSFNRGTAELMKCCSTLVHVLSPSVSSLMATTIAMEGYHGLDISENSICLVGNHVNGPYGIPEKKVESVIDRAVDAWIPWAAKEFIHAENVGSPVTSCYAKLDATHAFQELGLLLSKPTHLRVPPASPSALWLQLQQRLGPDLQTQSVLANKARSGSGISRFFDRVLSRQ